METVQKTLRLHLAIFGRVNAGKSSFLNLVAGQNIAITSDVAGTTTDIVEKSQELIPLGPVVWMDTAGLGDETPLGRQRMEKASKPWIRQMLSCSSAPEIISERKSRKLSPSVNNAGCR